MENKTENLRRKKIDFNTIVNSGASIKIPSYQRAYSWKEEQIKQFVNDLIEIKDKRYYYGHFIIENDETNNIFEIIDGQQRITTYVLFVLALTLYENYDICNNLAIKEFIRDKRFQTIDYDQKRFDELVENIVSENILIEANVNDTSSFKRILSAIESFKKIFDDKKEFDYVDLLNTLLNAEVSTHFTEDKKIAVQIFELQNSRGLKLDLIEKVKALLMKEIYLNSGNESVESNISEMQQYFSSIYQLEEKTKESSFRGDLTLNNILFHHLRVIDDGVKKLENQLFSPNGSADEIILKYIKDQVDSKETVLEKANYVITLSNLYFKSVKFICAELIDKDKQNPLIGDCIILDRSNSIELYLILNHINKFDILKVNLWEKLLFTSNFHNKYQKKSKRDNYQWLFGTIINRVANNESENINAILENFVNLGFRRKLFDDDLQGVFLEYIQTNKQKILTNGFNFWKPKVIYLLYKYEINIEENKTEIRGELRQLFKNKLSVEHILPQSWNKDWINEETKVDSEFHDNVNSFVNGIGNLLLLTVSENSSENNKHPKDKKYRINHLGSYKEHFVNSESWKDSNKWKDTIENRGNKIYDFLLQYFK